MRSLFATAVAVVAVARGAQAQECVPLVEAAQTAGLYSLLSNIVTTAETSSAIQGVLNLATQTTQLPHDQSVTIFAPTNEAFGVFGNSAPFTVEQVLLNHVVSGELDVAAVLAAVNDAAPEPAQVPTLLPDFSLAVFEDEGDVIITPQNSPVMAKVVVTDVKTCIGIVHIVDTVLEPFEDVADTEGKECVSLAQAATDAGLTSILGAVTEAAETSPGVRNLLDLATYDEWVAGAQRITVFAPTNGALAAVGDISPNTISQVLLNHVVGLELPVAAVLAAIEAAAPEAAVVTSWQGVKLNVTKSGEDVVITPQGTDVMAKVVVTDVETCVGTVHVIDAVLNFSAEEVDPTGAITTPDTPVTPAPVAPVAEYMPAAGCFTVAQAAQRANLTSLLAAITSTALTSPSVRNLLEFAAYNSPLDAMQRITIFAPTNDAFAMLGDIAPNTVDQVLVNHVVSGDLPVAAVLAAIETAAPAAAVVPSWLGGELGVMMSGEDVVITPQDTDVMAKVVVTDVETCVGTVHVIDTVLNFSAEQLGTEISPKLVWA